jgi:S-adenosylmethionine hydrolase
MTAYAYFPSETVHLAVVDPGVGSQRRAIAVAFGTDSLTGFLVGPDNGLFSGVLSQTSIVSAVELTNRQYWRVATPSSTFHGRDIFAPVAAHLASGVPLQDLGSAIAPETLVHCSIPACVRQISRDRRIQITGYIQAVDRFGNLITNIPGAELINTAWSVQIGEQSIAGGTTYSDRPQGELVALIGSDQWVELAVNGGNAQATLKVSIGDGVTVTITPKLPTNSLSE